MAYKTGKWLTVGGVDLFDEYGMVLLDGFEVPPPAPKVYEVDIPGGDGTIDVTEALMGDVAYSNRECSFELLYVGGGDFQAAKSALAAFLHGRRLDFQLSWDPGCTYTGRWKVDAWYSEVHAGRVRLACTADPYKLRERKVVRAAAAGGVAVNLPCGRKRQCPTVECDSECLVSFGGEAVRVQPGSWTLPGLWLTEGDNEVYVNSDLSGGDLALGDWWGSSLSSLSGERLSDLMWSERPPDTEARAVYFAYDIMDL